MNNSYKVFGLKNSGDILDEIKGALDSKRKQFITAIASIKKNNLDNKFSNHLGGVTNKNLEPLVYLNLVERDVNFFKKRAKHLISFNDQRLMNLLTILADDEFWKLYASLRTQYNNFITYKQDKNKENNNYLHDSSFLGIANRHQYESKNSTAERSILVRILYFLMGGNPYCFQTLGTSPESDLETSLEAITINLQIEQVLLENIMIELGLFAFTNSTINEESKLTFDAYQQFLLKTLMDCQELRGPLKKIWTGKDLMDADDLITLWGKSKKSFMNERAQKDSFIARVDYGEFSYSRDDSIEWLKKKKALGTFPFNTFCHDKEVQIDDLDNDEKYNLISAMNAKIKVVGVGGAGGNAVINMINHNIEGVDFICANTDTQALSMADGAITLKLDSGLTKGVGAGANPDVGRKEAESARAAIEELLVGADMIFITAGMGGGTGTGAAPVVASIAKDLGVLTIGIVSKPFDFEGEKRMTEAEMGLHNLEKYVDCLFVMNNQTMIDGGNSNIPLSEAFERFDLQAMNIVQVISNIILKPSYINVDFADISLIFSNSGYSRIIQGQAKNIHHATHFAIRDEFIEDISLKNARGVLVNITAAKPTLGDQKEVADIVEEIVQEDANIIYAVQHDETAGDDILVSILFSVGRFNQKNNLKRFIRKKQTTASDMDFLDVPAFIRKQVD